ncbi:MAG TPA: hypothetical protein VKU92_11080 [Acidimicrobiales bacterium]|nr:hypothetical protein [Acidimicrobiales bacterium]
MSTAGRLAGRRSPRLAPLAEPAGLLAVLREAARQAPAQARDSAPRVLAAHAARAWQDGAGPAREAVEAAFASARREIWLWVKGNRSWEQLAGSLAGRVERRLR